MVKVAFKHYDSRVLPEMGAKVLFLTKAAEASTMQEKPFLSVPQTALATRDGKKIVFRVEDNKAVAVPISAGRELGSSIEILDGITVGEKVIDKIDGTITNGVKVKVL
jgi:multidrug efflux pump subunit AcrA (membrane-fusion protein)